MIIKQHVQKSHSVFFLREIVVHKVSKETRVQLDPLVPQEQMAFPELTGRLEHQGGMD